MKRAAVLRCPLFFTWIKKLPAMIKTILLVILVVLCVALLVLLSPFITLLGLAYLCVVYPRELRYNHELRIAKIEQQKKAQTFKF
jgi:hypothetical protein